jgi:hypothetical protein
MKYFQNPDNQQVFAYDEENPLQKDLINQAIDNNWKDVSSLYPLKPSKDQIIAQYEFAAQINLDKVAQLWGYDSLVSAASYSGSANPQFKAEAEALINWRDNYWSEAYTIEAGTLPATSDAFLALLPAAPTKPVI